MTSRETNEYFKANVNTAGTLKSLQLLAERAVVLLSDPAGLSDDKQVKVQNIIVQLQSGMNVTEAPARDIHKALSIVWDAVEMNDPDINKRSLPILRDLIETLKEVQKKISIFE